MMRFFSAPASFLLTAITAALPLHGQGEKGASVVYRMSAFGVGALESTAYGNSPGGPFVKVAKQHVTNPVEAKLREGGFLDLYAEDGAAEEGPAHSLKVPAGNRSDLLVIFINDGKETKPALIDLKAIGLQRGGQYVYNLLPVPIAVQCGEKAKPVSIKAGGKASIPAPSGGKVIQTLYYADAKTNKPVKFSSSIYFKDEQSRQIVFCYAVEGAKLPKVAPISIYDAPRPDAEGS